MRCPSVQLCSPPCIDSAVPVAACRRSPLCGGSAAAFRVHHIGVHTHRNRCQLFIIRGCSACVWIPFPLTSAWATLVGNDVRLALWTVLEKTAVHVLHHVVRNMMSRSMYVALILGSHSKTGWVCGLPRGIRANVDRLLLRRSHLSSVNLVTCRSSSGLTSDVDGV